MPCPLLKKLVERREIVVMGEILRQYTEARINERLHLFLQFPDLRRSFQEINRKDLAFQKTSLSLREGHNKAKYSLCLLLLRRACHRIIEIRILKNWLKSLNPIQQAHIRFLNGIFRKKAGVIR